MPTVYLSPSLQEFNPYVDGGNEEYYMNLIADDMVPILERAGITVVRNRSQIQIPRAATCTLPFIQTPLRPQTPAT